MFAPCSTRYFTINQTEIKNRIDLENVIGEMNFKLKTFEKSINLILAAHMINGESKISKIESMNSIGTDSIDMKNNHKSLIIK